MCSNAFFNFLCSSWKTHVQAGFLRVNMWIESLCLTSPGAPQWLKLGCFLLVPAVLSFKVLVAKQNPLVESIDPGWFISTADTKMKTSQHVLKCLPLLTRAAQYSPGVLPPCCQCWDYCWCISTEQRNLVEQLRFIVFSLSLSGLIYRVPFFLIVCEPT